MTDHAETLDLLYGARKIGAFLGISARKTYYLLETGALPAFKLGKQWCARKSSLLEFIAQLECKTTTEQGKQGE